jgi:hypothetical protein
MPTTTTPTPSSTSAPKPDFRATAGSLDVAIDNLWNTKDDLFMNSIMLGKPATMKKDPSGLLIGKNQKMTGTIVYFLPKDKNGKLIGAPVKLLKIAGKTNTYLDGTKVSPYYEDIVKNKTYWVSLGGGDLVAEAESKLSGIPIGTLASKFTGLDDIRNEMGSIGADGVMDLLNAEGLDESVSIETSGLYSNLTNESLLNVAGIGKARALKNTGRFVNHNGIYRKEGHHTKGTEKRVADVRVVRLLNPKLGFVEKRNVLIFADGTAGAPNKWENVSGLTNESLLNQYGVDESLLNFTNESLLDGLTENTSLLNATGKSGKYFPDKSVYSNLVNESLLDADGDTEYSNGVGSWFKGLFDGKKKGDALKKVSDPNVSVVDAKTMQDAYKESGSGKSFNDWINSEGGKGIMNSITMLTSMLINKPLPSDSTNYGGGYQPDGGGTPPKKETTILGMSPITFGIVALGLVAIGSIVVIKIIKSKQGKN